jgi:hypothetical protein
MLVHGTTGKTNLISRAIAPRGQEGQFFARFKLSHYGTRQDDSKHLKLRPIEGITERTLKFRHTTASEPAKPFAE